jgi:hypothetical protein
MVVGSSNTYRFRVASLGPRFVINKRPIGCNGDRSASRDYIRSADVALAFWFDQSSPTARTAPGL